MTERSRNDAQVHSQEDFCRIANYRKTCERSNQRSKLSKVRSADWTTWLR
ncbi:hypothetical protein [Pseudomonas syringae]|nr:hypothetical protein [Pseudomonas syringae]